MVESTRPKEEVLPDPQEETKDNLVEHLRNQIQVVENTFNQQMTAVDRQLYTLRRMINLLMEEKSDPMVSQADIQKEIEEKQAKMEPWVAAANRLRLVREEFKVETQDICAKTELRLKSQESKSVIADSAQSEMQRILAKVANLE